MSDLRCSVSNCSRTHHAQGLCRKHYDFVKQHGAEAALKAGIPLGLAAKATEAPKAVERDEQLLYLRQANSQLEREITKLYRVIGNQKEMASTIAAAVVAAEPFPRYSYKLSKGAGQPVEAGVMFSDWHIGEQVDANETEGFGEFNWEIAQRRIFGIVDSIIDWIQTSRNSYRIDRLHIMGIGDYIAGDIHRELSVTNEFPVPVQTAKAGLLFGEVVARLAIHFPEIFVYQVGADNHGRLTAKPQFKQRFLNSYSYLVHTISETYLQKHGNVNLIPSLGIKYLAEVAGHRFLINHGDTVKAWMGIPFYGIEREKAREAVKRMNTELGFHYQALGHWHVPSFLNGSIFINGSLSGTNEYDHGCGRHSGPAQMAFLVHPKHGAFNYVPFKGY